MTTSQYVNFDIESDLTLVVRRDLALADPTLLLPSNANLLLDGEWVNQDSAGKFVRAAAIGAAGNAATKLSFPVWMEPGAAGNLARAERAVTYIAGGYYEGVTKLFDASAAVGSGAAITAFQQPLKVASVTVNGRVVVGLVGHGGKATDSAPIVGYVLELPTAANGQVLRFSGAQA